MHRLLSQAAGLVFLCLLGAPAVFAQPNPASTVTRYEILSLDVEGARDEGSSQYVAQISGLQAGQRVALPYDEAFGEAIRKLYRGGLYSEVDIIADRILGDGVFLLIRVVEEPRLGTFTIDGVSGGERDDLENDLPLFCGSRRSAFGDR